MGRGPCREEAAGGGRGSGLSRASCTFQRHAVNRECSFDIQTSRSLGRHDRVGDIILASILLCPFTLSKRGNRIRPVFSFFSLILKLF